jgi:hypothetical protein
VSVNPRFERMVIAEMARRERRARRSSPVQSAASHALALRLHAGHHDLLGHLWRVASALPDAFRRVAWLHHVSSDCLKTDELAAAGLTVAEIDAVELLASPHPLCDAVPLDRARAIASAPGTAGAVARVVARAALADRVRDGGPRPGASTALRVVNGAAASHPSQQLGLPPGFPMRAPRD